MLRPRVDLPQPDSPTRPSVSPCRISRSTPSPARTWGTVLCMSPDVIGNQVFKPRTSTSGSSAVQAGLRAARVAASGMRSSFGPGRAQVFARLGHPAGGTLRASDRQERRGLLDTAPDPERAPGMERAAAGQVGQIGRQALDGTERLVLLGV